MSAHSVRTVSLSAAASKANDEAMSMVPFPWVASVVALACAAAAFRREEVSPCQGTTHATALEHKTGG